MRQRSKVFGNYLRGSASSRWMCCELASDIKIRRSRLTNRTCMRLTSMRPFRKVDRSAAPSPTPPTDALSLHESDWSSCSSPAPTALCLLVLDDSAGLEFREPWCSRASQRTYPWISDEERIAPTASLLPACAHAIFPAHTLVSNPPPVYASTRTNQFAAQLLSGMYFLGGVPRCHGDPRRLEGIHFCRAMLPVRARHGSGRASFDGHVRIPATRSCLPLTTGSHSQRDECVTPRRCTTRLRQGTRVRPNFTRFVWHRRRAAKPLPPDAFASRSLPPLSNPDSHNTCNGELMSTQPSYAPHPDVAPPPSSTPRDDIDEALPVKTRRALAALYRAPRGVAESAIATFGYWERIALVDCGLIEAFPGSDPGDRGSSDTMEAASDIVITRKGRKELARLAKQFQANASGESDSTQSAPEQHAVSS
jgi:hypothetical protein